MQLPSTVADKFRSYPKVRSDEELLRLLLRDPEDFIEFFVSACEDETWCGEHEFFVKNALNWVTEKSFQNKLPLPLATQAACAIQKHFQNLKNFLPINLTFNFAGDSRSVNSLLFQAASPYWHAVIYKECFSKGGNSMDLSAIDQTAFSLLEEFVYTGGNKELWRLEQPEILKVLKAARFTELKSLELACEEVLLRYVDRFNYVDFMQIAEQLSLDSISRRCADICNSLQDKLILTYLGSGKWAAQILSQAEASLEEFLKYTAYITHAILGPKALENSALIPALAKCPKLESIDIGQTASFDEALFDLAGVQELVLAGCSWLKDAHLALFVKAFPDLQRLNLRGCSSITASGFATLVKLPKLIALSVAGSENLGDSQFELILSAARLLRELDAGECRNLSPRSFHQLAIAKQPLELLCIKRTAVTDAGLLEIASRKNSVVELDISRCPNLTEEGVIDSLKQFKSLKRVNLSNLHFSERGLALIHSAMPALWVINES